MFICEMNLELNIFNACCPQIHNTIDNLFTLRCTLQSQLGDIEFVVFHMHAIRFFNKIPLSDPLDDNRILSLKPLYSFIEWINGSKFERLIELIKWNSYFAIK